MFPVFSLKMSVLDVISNALGTVTVNSTLPPPGVRSLHQCTYNGRQGTTQAGRIRFETQQAPGIYKIQIAVSGFVEQSNPAGYGLTRMSRSVSRPTRQCRADLRTRSERCGGGYISISEVW